MIIDEETHEELMHYGTPRHSGRYPWGSHGWHGDSYGQDPRNMSFLDFITHLKRNGLSANDIAKGLSLSTTELRSRTTVAKAEKRMAQIGMAQRLADKGNKSSAIAKRMRIPEATVRTLLAPGAADRAQVLTSVSDMLKKEVDTKHFVDVGRGVETGVTSTGISKERLAAAVRILQSQGYTVHNGIKVPQLGTGKETQLKVLARPGTTWGEVQKNKDNIQQITAFSKDGGRTFAKVHDPLIIDPNRVDVKYGSAGGSQADGVIYVRRGVPDVSLGSTPYAQVRVQVGPGHYLKGMAMYSDNLPPGKDLQFNTKKESTGNKLDAFKPIKDDPTLPYEAITYQLIDGAGTPHERVTSAMNIVGGKVGAGQEGGWETWSKKLSSQFLSKQSPTLVKAQLAKTGERKQKEFDEIMALTNPTVRKNLLQKFADSADSSAVHLEAAALSREQAWHVILPLNSLKPNEIYAPRYKPGTRVVLIRHPHGGTFEIPELIVNDRHPEGQRLIGDARDAVGIHHSVAQRLSGADFDGDTVIVIPNNSGKIKSSPALEGLKNFDPMSYKIPEGSPIPKMTKRQEGIEMGGVSNLITDMTIKGAPHKDIVRAIKHSMVVIDAEKHGLNFRQSALDNGIAQLKLEYQGRKNAGASTIVSRAGAEKRVPERTGRKAAAGGPVNRETGRLEYTPTNRTFVNRAGKTVLVTDKSTQLAEVKDAHELVSAAGAPIEKLYAEHANRLLHLANTARLEILRTPRIQWSDSAKVTYAKEVASLKAKVKIAKMNAPLERHAQVVAGAQVKLKRQASPDLRGDALKKVEYQQLQQARTRFGANKKERQIHITQEEWNAIQAGAISEDKLKEILANTDIEQVRKYATPHRTHKMTTANIGRARTLFESGHTRQEVASALGVSLSTLDASVKGSEQ